MLTIISATTVLGLIGAAFTLATAIGGRVIAQRRQIGLLRAIGITPLAVDRPAVAHYLGLAAARRAVRARWAAPSRAAAWSATARDALACPHPGRRARRCSLLALLAALAVVALATACRPGAPGGCRSTEPRSRSAAARRSGARLAARRAGARALRLPVVVGVGAKDAFAQRGRARS